MQRWVNDAFPIYRQLIINLTCSSSPLELPIHPSIQPYTLHEILTYLSIQLVQLSAYCQSITKYRHHRVKAMLLQMEEK